ncbi:MAG: hypothetical protein D3924_02610 [Candidatus Electrothrix sp. AR4]|nr:hypothetical protein [Candidatus Electrothrix sp. AR4]
MQFGCRYPKSDTKGQGAEKDAEEIELTAWPEIGLTRPGRQQEKSGSEPSRRLAMWKGEHRQTCDQKGVDEMKQCGRKGIASRCLPLEQRMLQPEKEKGHRSIEADQSFCEKTGYALGIDRTQKAVIIEKEEISSNMRIEKRKKKQNWQKEDRSSWKASVVNGYQLPVTIE